MNRHQQGVVVHKRMSFLASVVWGLCSVIVVTLVSAAGIAFFGLHILNSRSGDVLKVIGRGIEDLPAVARSVPVLADALSDERRLDYADQLDVDVAFQPYRHDPQRLQTVLTVSNDGDQVVSLLSMRVVVTDQDGRLLAADQEYVATPLDLGEHIYGPLLPGATRLIPLGSFRTVDHPTARHEFSDIRVWVKDLIHGTTPADTPGVHALPPEVAGL